MDKTLYDTVLDIATDVRYWAEGRAEGDTNNSAHALNGYCAIASAELNRQLTAAGIDSEIHVWESPVNRDSHVFVVVDDHVVDVTATQFRDFRDQAVVIMHVREAEAYKYWQSSYSFKTADELRARQKKDRWPPSQIAYAR